MSRHVMIDIETVGKKPGNAIVSIGALEFFPEAGVFGEEFHFAINLTDSLLHGLTVDPGTVSWWRKQPQLAQQAITDNPTSLKSALHLLTQFLHCPETHVIPKNMPIWCRGTNFDPVMLEAAFAAAGMDLPWKYWQWRDMRTLLKVCEEYKGYSEPARDDTAHDALDDCRHQARVVTQCLALMSPLPAPNLLSVMA